MAKPLFVTFSTIILMLIFNSTSAAIYKWKDKNGQVHYGSMPPQGSNAQKMGVSTTFTPAPPKKTTAKNTKTANNVKADDESKKDEYSKEQRDTLCKNAQKDMATMNKGGRLRVKQKDGSTSVLGDKERDQRMKTMQAMIKKHCK